MEDRPTADEVRTLVRLAGLAPSVHNSQPWHFSWDGGSLRLQEELSRSLPAADPSGRERVISCGVALAHAQLGLAELGWASTATPFPEGEQSTLLARLTPTERRLPSPQEHELALAIPRRTTDRDPYQAKAVPAQTWRGLVDAAAACGVWLQVLNRLDDRIVLQVLLSRADQAQQRDAAYLDELEAWRSEQGPVGVPSTALPSVPPGARASDLALRDFDAGRAAVREPAVEPPQPAVEPPRAEHSDVVVLGTDRDSRSDWLAAGQALGRVLLTATVAGLAAQPLTQVLELPVTRAQLRRALGHVGHPQVVLRIGYGTAGPTTRRLPVEQVLDPE